MFKFRIFVPFLAASLTALAAPPVTHAATCDDWFTQSQSMADVLIVAFDAINKKDAAAEATVLPRLEAAFNVLPDKEIVPETCSDHINAYTSYQFMELSLMRAHNIDSGFSTTLPLVKQPALNHEALAYATGWMKYEKEDYAGALAIYDKGLKMFPHSHLLQEEYLAALVQLARYQDVVDFADMCLGDTFDLDDEARAKLYQARGMAFYALGNMADAKDSLTIAQRYASDDDIQAMLDGIDDKDAAQ